MKRITKEQRCLNIVKRVVDNGYQIEQLSGFSSLADIINNSEILEEKPAVKSGNDLVAAMAAIIEEGYTFEDFQDELNEIVILSEEYLFDHFGIEGINTDAMFDTSGHCQNLTYCDDYGYQKQISGDIVDFGSSVALQNRVKWEDDKLVNAEFFKNCHTDDNRVLQWNDDCYIMADWFVDSTAKIIAVLVK